MGFEKGGAVDRPMAGKAEPDGIGLVIEGKLRSLRHRSFSSWSEIRSRTQELAAQSAKITAWSSHTPAPLHSRTLKFACGEVMAELTMGRCQV